MSFGVLSGARALSESSSASVVLWMSFKSISARADVATGAVVQTPEDGRGASSHSSPGPKAWQAATIWPKTTSIVNGTSLATPSPSSIMQVRGTAEDLLTCPSRICKQHIQCRVASAG